MSTDERLARIEEKLDVLGRDVGRLVSVERYNPEHAALAEAIRDVRVKMDQADDDRRNTRRLIFGSFLLPVLLYLVQTMQSAGAT